MNFTVSDYAENWKNLIIIFIGFNKIESIGFLKAVFFFFLNGATKQIRVC